MRLDVYIILITKGTKEKGYTMFVLVSYSNDECVQDLFYHGKFNRKKDICSVLEGWVNTYFDRNMSIEESAFVDGLETECGDVFCFEMYNDKADGCIYGSMYYNDDYFRIKFCIVEV